MANKTKVRIFNWAGSKYLYIDKINNLLINKEYDNVVDGFLGSGNLILNLEVNSKKFIGYDIIGLLPKIYDFLSKDLKKDPTFRISENAFWDIIKQYDFFKDKTNYYDFREDWNKDYKFGVITYHFVISTILLLKMMSNSMVRFNRKGEFNQGFRGTKDISVGFFNKEKVNNIVNEFNKLLENLSNSNYSFYNKDLLDDIKQYGENDLLILDPPYLLGHAEGNLYGMGGKDWNSEKEKELLNFLKNDYKGDFIYFNYLSVNKEKLGILSEFLKDNKNLQIIKLREQVSTGQKRVQGTKEVEEVLITNINNLIS